jgi:hypothetical protein
MGWEQQQGGDRARGADAGREETGGGEAVEERRGRCGVDRVPDSRPASGWNGCVTRTRSGSPRSAASCAVDGSIQRAPRGAQLESPADLPPLLRLPLRSSPHRPHLPLLRRHRDRPAGQVIGHANPRRPGNHGGFGTEWVPERAYPGVGRGRDLTIMSRAPPYEGRAEAGTGGGEIPARPPPRRSWWLPGESVRVHAGGPVVDPRGGATNRCVDPGGAGPAGWSPPPIRTHHRVIAFAARAPTSRST